MCNIYCFDQLTCTIAVTAEAVAFPHVPPEAAAGTNALPRAAMAQNPQAVNPQSGRAACRGHGGRGGHVGRGRGSASGGHGTQEEMNHHSPKSCW